MRRAIDPRRGFWQHPTGFLESGETAAEGAAREVAEETGVLLDARELKLYGIGSLAHMNEVYVVFRAMVDEVALAPGDEALEARFFNEAEMPWNDVAFPTGSFAYRQTYEDIRRGRYGVYLASHDSATLARVL